MSKRAAALHLMAVSLDLLATGNPAAGLKARRSRRELRKLLEAQLDQARTLYKKAIAKTKDACPDPLQQLLEQITREQPASHTGSSARYAMAGYRLAAGEKQLSGAGLPHPAGRLVDLMTAEVAALTTRLAAGDITAGAWQEAFEVLITRYSAASLMAGQASEELGDQAASYLINYLGSQFDFLDSFTIEIQDAEEWQAGWTTRAEMYAQSIKAPYWTGQVDMLPLPAMPGDGTTLCVTNCKCEWEVDVVDDEAGDYDAYWRLGDADHCQTCIVRSRDWAPLKIRAFRLVD